MNWRKVHPNPADNDAHPERLPPPDTVVWIVYLSDHDNKPLIAFGGRSDGGEGWLWGVDRSGCYGQGFDAEIECDDEYRVTHWAEIEWPEGDKSEP